MDEESDDERELAEEEELDPEIWFQVSRKHRLVARFPPDKTGIEALRDIMEERWKRHSDVPLPLYLTGNIAEEASAGDQYLRVYAPKEYQRSLTRSQFQAFQRNGGVTYPEFCFKTKEKG